MKKGGKKEKERKEKDCGLQIVSPCFFFFFWRGRKLQEKYSTWKIKVTGERISLSLSLSYFLRGNGGFFFFTMAEERLEGLNLFVALMECIPFRVGKLS